MERMPPKKSKKKQTVVERDSVASRLRPRRPSAGGQSDNEQTPIEESVQQSETMSTFRSKAIETEPQLLVAVMGLEKPSESSAT